MPITEQHRDAIVQGRKESRAVRVYLEALTAAPSGPSNEESLRNRLERTEAALETETNTLKRLDLTQKKFDLLDQLSSTGESVDMEQLEADFVAVASGYSERKGIGYSAWRAAGVPPSVLAAAGISRTRRG